MLPSCTTPGRASSSAANNSPLATLSPSKTTVVAPVPPPPPFLLSRSHTSIELLPAPFFHPSSSPLSNCGDAVREEGGGRAILGSDGTFKAVTAASEHRARPKTRGTRVAKVSESPILTDPGKAYGTKAEIQFDQQETKSIIDRCQNVNGNPSQYGDSIRL